MDRRLCSPSPRRTLAWLECFQEKRTPLFRQQTRQNKTRGSGFESIKTAKTLAWLAALGFASAGAFPAAAQPAPPAPPQPPGVILQGLDKVTARISTIEVPLDTLVRFGTLEIAVRACYKTPPTEPPESTAFLEIVEIKPGEPRDTVFSGWMFASSPALSALEHPVYDIWVIDCTNVENSASLNPG